MTTVARGKTNTITAEERGGGFGYSPAALSEPPEVCSGGNQEETPIPSPSRTGLCCMQQVLTPTVILVLPRRSSLRAIYRKAPRVLV